MSVTPAAGATSKDRRVLLLVSVIVLVDVSFYAAIAPLLPSYVDDLGLSKAQAGVLVGSYAVGTLLASLPAGWLVGRAGARRTVVLGLVLLAAASLAFGLGDSFAVLAAARFVQGVGGAASWAAGLAWLVEVAPRHRRGQMIGTVLGAGVAGALGGPVLGAVAQASSAELVFGLVAAVAVGLGVAVAMTHTAGDVPRSGDLRLALGDPRVRLGAWLNAVPALFFGVLGVLVPLRLDVLGASALVVAGVFLVAAAVEAVASPIAGRASDRVGALVPLRAGLAGVLVACLALPWPSQVWLLALTAVAAAAFAGVLMAPASALLSDGAEDAGLSQGVAFGLYNLAWAAGQAVGSMGGARLAGATTDASPYLAVGATAAVTLLALTVRRPAWRNGTGVDDRAATPLR